MGLAGGTGNSIRHLGAKRCRLWPALHDARRQHGTAEPGVHRDIVAEVTPYNCYRQDAHVFADLGFIARPSRAQQAGQAAAVVSEIRGPSR